MAKPAEASAGSAAKTVSVTASRRLPWLWPTAGLVALVALLVAPLAVDASVVQSLISIFTLAVLAESWNIIGGFTGYAAFGNAVFFGLGAYATGIAMVRWSWPFFGGLAFAALVAVAFALVIGLPILRLRGHYFALATLGLSEVVRRIVENMEITGGGNGMVLPILRNLNFFYYAMLGVLLAAIAFTWWLSRSKLGYGLVAIREDEDAAQAMGINTPLLKSTAYAASALFAGLAGGVYAYWMTYIEPPAVFQTILNVKMIVMAVFGGTGTIFGPVIGAFILTLISDALATRLVELANLFFGVVIIVAVLFFPKGLMSLGRRRGTLLAYFKDSIKANRV